MAYVKGVWVDEELTEDARYSILEDDDTPINDPARARRVSSRHRTRRVSILPRADPAETRPKVYHVGSVAPFVPPYR